MKPPALLSSWFAKDAGRLFVKVCGITRVTDAELALELGASALGVNFWPGSPRYLPPGPARQLLNGLPPGSLALGIVVLNAGFDPAALTALPVTAFQVHGATCPEDLPDLGKPLLVAVSAETAGRFEGYEIIVDTSWGRGETADWSALAHLGRPFVLSGGLNPENVGAALRALHPAGIDVCSGVEAAPGIKDPGKLARFMTAVRKAQAGERVE